MWARVAECMLGCWLAISPFVFQHGDNGKLWVADYLAGSLVIGFGLLSFWSPLRWMHLLTILVAAGMIGFGRVADGWEPAAGYQNHLVTGLLLLMLSIVPNDASLPPSAWYPVERKEFPR